LRNIYYFIRSIIYLFRNNYFFLFYCIMKRPTKSDDGTYHVHGKKYPILIGTRAQVWHGTAYKTSGGLTKQHLMQNKAGRIVSRAKHVTAKKEMRLVKHGYGTKKGKFGYVKLNGRRSRSRHSRRSKKMRGGLHLTPADVNAPYMMKDVVPQHFGPLQRALVGGAPYGNEFVPEDVGKTMLLGDGIAGAGVTNFDTQGSVGVQERAGMAGGRRHRGKRGGTTSHRLDPMDINDPQQRALMAGGKKHNLALARGRSRSARRALALAGGQVGSPVGADMTQT
jgi:hypothetical protein